MDLHHSNARPGGHAKLAFHIAGRQQNVGGDTGRACRAPDRLRHTPGVFLPLFGLDRRHKLGDAVAMRTVPLVVQTLLMNRTLQPGGECRGQYQDENHQQ